MIFTLALSTALAVDFPATSLVAVHGWTAEGELVYEVQVWDHYAPAVVEDASDMEPGSVRHVRVQRGDQLVHDWVIGSELPKFVLEPAPPSAEAEWTAWRAAHPLKSGATSQTGPTGARWEMLVQEGGDFLPATCKADSCVAYGSMDSDAPEARAQVALTPGQGRWPLLTWTVASSMWTSSLDTQVHATWSPDGHDLAVFREVETVMMMRGLVFGTLSVDVYDAWPLIGVLTPPKLGKVVSDKVVKAIEGAGAVQTAEAKAERSTTIVYAKAGFEAEAAAIAAKVPGGATVEPMTWEGPQHLVVAVGASAK